jgi:hypothetical protein
VREAQFRTLLIRRITARQKVGAGSRIFQEFALPQQGARIDLALVNSQLSGFEIKTDRDSLARLPSQELAYGKVFDRLYLVAQSRHIDKGADLLPSWWGLIELTSGKWVQHRPAGRNPKVDLTAVVKLLWRDEAYALLEQIGESRGLRSAPKAALWGAISDSAFVAKNPAGLRRYVRTALKKRAGQTAELERKSDGDLFLRAAR